MADKKDQKVIPIRKTLQPKSTTPHMDLLAKVFQSATTSSSSNDGLVMALIEKVDALIERFDSLESRLNISPYKKMFG